ncbi:glucose 1-dehydrogenase [Aliiruegeria haliotis]|uniref:Glucose 1-dehydrogenase n=1 Tax=Aliiruegeria haliotis TaxID=1280846 RepID=A0A2T0REB1_9RHOB|nr:glucose 1-dehydrogenase [Aliiruegeria haliotis]PRY19536.1 glucose 1-dehydrogenase [Aliiruegeria haliotis]
MTGRKSRGALIVTGGSRGIGAAICRRAARDGWDVVVNYRTGATQAAEVVREIEATGARALAVQGDIGCEADIVALFEQADAAFGHVGGLVNNAGILESATTLADIPTDRWERVLRVNATGSFVATRLAVQRMLRAGRGGAIVNISSMAAPLGAPNEFVDYAASKGAMESMTIGLAREVGPAGIRVNAVRPGLIDTEIHADAGRPDRVQALADTVPLKRAGTAEEVAEAVVWLLSDGASYVTGAILPVSGGR